MHSNNIKSKLKKMWKKLKRLLRKSNTNKRKNFDIYDESKPPKEIHEQLYSQLLYVYTDNIGENLKSKIKLKNRFFYTVMGVFILTFLGGGVLFFKLFQWLQNEGTLDITKSIVSVVGIAIPTLSTMVVSLIEIPKIITKYLFNVQEEKYMKQIIKNLQDYDKEVFGKECDINSRIEISRRNSENIDDSLGNFSGNIQLDIPEVGDVHNQSESN